MNKRILIVLSLVMVLSMSVALFACNGGGDEDTDTAYAYCSKMYSADMGTYGSFAISAMDEAELEENLDDLSRYTLDGAFKGMTIESARLDYKEYEIVFNISGTLKTGNTGSIEGEGIIKGRKVAVDVPIVEAEAGTTDKIYANAGTQTVDIELMAACFNKDIKPSDFELSGAAEGMTITAVATEYMESEGELYLSQNATITLSGEPNGLDYANITVKAGATTYNKDLVVNIVTDYYGAMITDSVLDTFTLEDVLYIRANNIHFKKDIVASEITFEGALEGYAGIKQIDYVDDSLIALHVTFPYNYIDLFDTLGYVKLAPTTNLEAKECVSTVVLSSPSIDYTVTQGDAISIDLTLVEETFNLVASADVDILDENGADIIVSGLEIVDLEDEDYSIKFVLPESVHGIVTVRLNRAYDIVLADGSTKSISIVMRFDVE